MKSYRQYCGLARALEVIGDRWNLLIVRQLLAAPARYSDLRDGLPGIATNLLADRLRELEAVGVVERRVATNGSGVEYMLTPWGAELREPIEGLIRWSTPLMVRGPDPADAFRPEWPSLALPALLRARLPAETTATIDLEVDGSSLVLAVDGAEVTVSAREESDGLGSEATLHAGPHALLGLAAGALSLDDAVALGLVQVEGDESVVHAVLEA